MKTVENSFKILLIAPSNTEEFIKDKLKLTPRFAEDYKSTIGTRILNKEIVLDQSKTIRMVIWELAGWAQFKKVAQSYISNVEGAIFIINLWEEKTYDTVINQYPEIKKYSGSIPFMLIGRVSSSQKTKLSIKENVIEFCDDEGGKYIEVSTEKKYDFEKILQNFSRGVLKQFDERLK